MKEDKIDFNELKSLLGENVEEKDEYYRFTWAGKNQARLEANKPTTATLRPNKEDSKDWDNTGNIFIEGDNLEVLKLLQKSYANKIKMIYIDPPYNTGKDFVYKDNYTDNLGNYLELTGQLDESGKKTSTNTESDGRYHSNWLNMMYPRLRLARNLMTDDGVIFISIDDNEVHNLRKLCDEIFGEDNFIEIFNWVKTETPPNLSKKSKKNIEYILCYQKNKNDNKFRGLKKLSKSSNGLLNQPNSVGILNFPENIVKTNIEDRIIQKGMYGTENYDVELLEDTEVKNNLFIKPVILKAKFKWSQDYLDQELKNQTEIFIQTLRFSPSYEKSEYEAEVPSNLINSKVNVGTNENAGNDLTKLMGVKVFDYPKPVSLLEYLIKFNEQNDSIILDFFAGSGSLAEAVLLSNITSEYKKSFISVQLPEKIEILPSDNEDQKKVKTNAIEFLINNNKPTTIAEITKERIRRAGEKIKQDFKDKEGIEKLDVGFKAFKLDSSNIVAWDGNPDKLAEQLDAFANNIKTDRTEEDILFEILLKYGLDLTVAIEEKTIAGQKVYSVGLGTLFICLANTITPEISEGIGSWKQELSPARCRVIYKDTGFNSDKDKVNAMQILKRFGVEEVNSI
ncbi:MAG: site-specific DNA-methyltransferase [Flavobacterium sp.]|uniref:site-specific DNA-methyltransferase n=2 Tax=Flavobacterium sp. TaxID=239 RepID=UPI0022C90F27|nr:site-specific DNA-methyltransferase [Flavobacterium sp.]MCZ8297753.1 site-specific DNA-methyltransferase [Flavobacterium sp.]